MVFLSRMMRVALSATGAARCYTNRTRGMMKQIPADALTKVPAVTLTFWIIKIAATTLGETGGDTVTMTFHWGYLTGTALFLAILVGLVVAQIVTKKFNPWLYWATIVASTTFGTTMADFADRSLGIGYAGGIDASLRLPRDDSWTLVLVAWLDLGSHGEYAKGGSLLLGRDHFLANTWHRPW